MIGKIPMVFFQRHTTRSIVIFPLYYYSWAVNSSRANWLLVLLFKCVMQKLFQWLGNDFYWWKKTICYCTCFISSIWKSARACAMLWDFPSLATYNGNKLIPWWHTFNRQWAVETNKKSCRCGSVSLSRDTLVPISRISELEQHEQKEVKWPFVAQIWICRFSLPTSLPLSSHSVFMAYFPIRFATPVLRIFESVMRQRFFYLPLSFRFIPD